MTPTDLPAVAACLASAFAGDPVWGAWTFPDAETREDGLRRLMGFWAACASRHSWVRTAGRVDAVAVWIPPGEPEMTPAEEDEFEGVIAELAGPRAGEVTALVEQFERHHPHAEPHYYLSLWGTRRERAGRGLGTALLRDCLAEIDAEHAPAYLESTNPANLARYRALGFEAVTTFAAAGSPTVTTMWRPAR